MDQPDGKLRQEAPLQVSLLPELKNLLPKEKEKTHGREKRKTAASNPLARKRLRAKKEKAFHRKRCPLLEGYFAKRSCGGDVG